MAASAGIKLLENKDNLTEEAGQRYAGGPSALVASADSYSTTCQLQLEHIDGVWISLGANITANGLQELNLPPGNYRMILTGGTATNLYVTLTRVND